MLSRDIKPRKIYWCMINGERTLAKVLRRSGQQWVVMIGGGTYPHWLSPCQITQAFDGAAIVRAEKG